MIIKSKSNLRLCNKKANFARLVFLFKKEKEKKLLVFTTQIKTSMIS